MIKHNETINKYIFKIDYNEGHAVLYVSRGRIPHVPCCLRVLCVSVTLYFTCQRSLVSLYLTCLRANIILFFTGPPTYELLHFTNLRTYMLP